MRLHVTLHHTRLGATEFTVVRPAGPLPRAVLVDHDRYVDACLDEDAGSQAEHALRVGGVHALDVAETEVDAGLLTCSSG
jgi:hypothetical protein